MLIASYFVVAAALGLWLLPEFLADERLMNFPRRWRQTFAMFVFVLLLFWPATTALIWLDHREEKR